MLSPCISVRDKYLHARTDLSVQQLEPLVKLQFTRVARRHSGYLFIKCLQPVLENDVMAVEYTNVTVS